LGESKRSSGIGILVESTENTDGERSKDEIVEQKQGIFEQVGSVESVEQLEPEHGYRPYDILVEETGLSARDEWREVRDLLGVHVGNSDI
jgi:hypothetical protein